MTDSAKRNRSWVLGTPHFQQSQYQGLLVIGDPHLEARVPGFRKDDYPRTILRKLRWCLEHAKEKSLLPVLLGDLFQLPRDNPNWMIVELLEMLDQPILGIYGNHDVHENRLDENDSLSILVEANRIQLLSNENMLRIQLAGRNVLLGGTSWGQSISESISSIPADLSGDPLVVWICHHDLVVPGYEEAGKIQVSQTLPVDLIINGHIHRRLEPHQVGRTTVLTPGNITRRKRSDMTREHRPSVLVVGFDETGWSKDYVEVPHEPFDDVFHPAVETPQLDESQSGFVTGLAELQARRTETGAGLSAFLDANLNQFEDSVADEIQRLAKEVLEETS